ncbi:protein sprint [Ixodes scapularis]
MACSLGQLLSLLDAAAAKPGLMPQDSRAESASAEWIPSHHGLTHDATVTSAAAAVPGPAVRAAAVAPGDGREMRPPPVPPRGPMCTNGTYASHLLAPCSSPSPSLSSRPLAQERANSSSASTVEELHCSMTLLERLIRTSSIWFLPDIGRSGAVHYLQGKEVGNFIVRQSSKKGTLALSVRLPLEVGPYIEHYLIEATPEGKHRLEGSDNHFASVPVLICHYCQCCDELPVRLGLPSVLMQPSTRQELSAFSLLGQELWVSSLLRSNPSTLGSTGSSTATNPLTDHNANVKSSAPKPTAATPVSTPVTSPTTSEPPVVHASIAVRPSFLPLQNCTNSGIKPVPLPRAVHPPVHQPIHQPFQQPVHQPFQPPVHQPIQRAVVPPSPSSISEVAGRSAFYVGVDTDRHSASPDTKEVPRCLANDKETKQLPRCLVREKKPSVRRRRVSIAESSPEAYYCSSLADKISDYEDIWGNANGKGSDTPGHLSTFKPNLDKSSPETNGELSRLSGKGWSEAIQQRFVCQSTQTEVHGGSLPGGLGQTGGDATPPPSPLLSRSMPGIANADGEEQNGVAKASGGHFSSPFYAEPVDSLFPGLPLNGDPLRIDEDSLHLEPRPVPMRHSEPNVYTLQQRCSDLTSTFDETTSCSTDRPIGASTPALCRGSAEGRSGRSWSVDPSWKWLGSSDDEDDEDSASMAAVGELDPKFPAEETDDSDTGFAGHDPPTVEDLIALASPDLRVPRVHPLTEGNVLRASKYDNLNNVDAASLPRSEGFTATAGGSRRTTGCGGGEEDALTEFCEPWDSLRWERLLRLVDPARKSGRQAASDWSRMSDAPKSKVEDSRMSTDSVETAASVTSEDGASDVLLAECPTLAVGGNRSSGFQECLRMLLASRRIGGHCKKDSTVGVNVRSYIFKLVQERNTTFAMTIENFIQCTRESNETSPTVVMRNIRQFMSGMKNYLLKHGEGQFEQLVQEEQLKLKSDEFMNIDAIIEVSLHRLVIKPLRRYLYQLFVNHYTKSGSLKLLSDNIKYARTKSPQDLGIRAEFEPPRGVSLELVQYFLQKLQKSYSPLRKLENLLAAISTIYNSVQKDKKTQENEYFSLGADDFLPIFLHVLVQCGMVSAEVEADYMWGLLHPSLLTGEGGYYLTTLSSAVHVLKNLGGGASSPVSSQNTPAPPSLTSSTTSASSGGSSAASSAPAVRVGDCKWAKEQAPVELRYPRVADLQGFMQIVIPDELSGSILSKTLPVMPNMTTKEVCKMIAHKFKVTNPEDYGLFKLVKGEETQLGDNECPQTIKADLLTSGIECRFAYKRCDIKFVWPFAEKPA